MGFWSLWCHTATEAASRFQRLVAEGAGLWNWHLGRGGGGCGWGWVGGMVDRTEALASVPVGEGCQQHARALQVLPFLYQCIVF
jgi:hypothetical protein